MQTSLGKFVQRGDHWVLEADGGSYISLCRLRNWEIVWFCPVGPEDIACAVPPNLYQGVDYFAVHSPIIGETVEEVCEGFRRWFRRQLSRSRHLENLRSHIEKPW